MSIAIIFNNKNPSPWQAVLMEKLANVSVEIYPNIKNKDSITFALVWKAEENILSQFPNLKVVQSVGASVDHITRTQQLADDVQVTRIVDRQLTIDMYEFLLTVTMNWLKQIPSYFHQEQVKKWSQIAYKNISDIRMTILGLGQIGAYCAVEFSKLGFHVKGWSRSAKGLPKVDCYHGDTGLSKALSRTDLLINILPLTHETRDILNVNNLQKLAKGAYLINVGRGEHLVENDLLQVLETGHLSGAHLDVFREEPLPEKHSFWELKNVTITPHVAALTNINTASNIVIENYNRMQQNEALLNVVSVNKGY